MKYMFYVVGLGNPGAKYERTRHNVGWMVLDAYREQHQISAPVNMKLYHSCVSQASVGEQEVWCVYPQTFMNQTGIAVRQLLRDEPTAKLLVVHDDIALPTGQIRISFARGHGGHNGVRSIIDQCKTKDFVRVRVGIAQKSILTGAVKQPASTAVMHKHVLGTFSILEQSAVREACANAVTAIDTVITDGQQVAMNMFN